MGRASVQRGLSAIRPVALLFATASLVPPDAVKTLLRLDFDRADAMSDTDDARMQVVIVAQALLAGRIGVIEGARRLVAIQSGVTKDDFDDDSFL